jgi:hypothetical protein
MSATTGFDLTQVEELVNETQFGTLFYQRALMENDTFAGAQANGQVLTAIKNDKLKLPLMEGTATLKDGTDCGFTPTDQTTFEQTELNMQAITVQGQFCVRELEPYWLAAGLPAGQHYEGMGVIQANILEETTRSVAEKFAIFPWHGPTGADTVVYGDSWFEQLRDATGIVVGSTAINNGGNAGTDAQGAFNVVEALKRKYTSNPRTAKEVFNGNIVCELSPNAASLYFENYRTLYGDHTALPGMQQLANGDMLTGWTHPGTKIQVVIQSALGINENDAAADAIVMYRKRNKVLGFDLASDATNIQLGMDQYKEFIWWKVRVKMGTAWRQITNPSITTPNVVYWGAAS